jgi:hypothetical protein
LEPRVPAGFDLAAQRKGFKRYSSAALKALVRTHEEAAQAAADAAGDILAVRRWAGRRPGAVLWGPARTALGSALLLACLP